MIVINPGAGPVDDASYDLALEAVKVFAKELGIDDIRVTRFREGDGEGRWGFNISHQGKSAQLLVPGKPVEFLKDREDWKVPRFYVDGSSWYWRFAIGIIQDLFNGVEE